MLGSEMAARWVTLGYDTPLLYDFNEVVRVRDIDAVAAGNGRIIYHWGAYSSPEAVAGEVRPAHPHSFLSGRSVAASIDTFTAHFHGYDPNFPDAGAPGATAAHEDVAWRLMEMFVAALKWVVPKNQWFMETRAKTLVRDPAQRRLGELVRLEFAVMFSIRADPLYPLQNPITKPTGVVQAAGGPVIVVEVP
jgi:hypothetical protein